MRAKNRLGSQGTQSFEGPSTFTFITLGCKSNQYDSAAMAADLTSRGMVSIKVPLADVIIINTCMVTGPAEAQCRKTIRQARRQNSGARIVVTGCMSKGAQDQLLSIEELDNVLDSSKRGQLPELIGLASGDRWVDWPDDPAVDMEGRDRVFIKVQDGCDYECSYCIVPSVRGKSRSLDPGKVIDGVRRLMDGKCREIVLTGVHLGQYGKDLGQGISLETLLVDMLAEDLPGRLRLSSIEPNELSSGLLDLIADSDGKICRHLHIPLQSGSDKILAAMGRTYRSEVFVDAVNRVRSRIPGIGIGCDLICGFPGETTQDFERSLEILSNLEIPFLHAFPYSPRSGTPSAQLKDNVPHRLKKDRVQILHRIAKKNMTRFLDKMVGGNLTVVPESSRNENGSIICLADNYIRVVVPGEYPMETGIMSVVKCHKREDEAILGYPVTYGGGIN